MTLDFLKSQNRVTVMFDFFNTDGKTIYKFKLQDFLNPIVVAGNRYISFKGVCLCDLNGYNVKCNQNVYVQFPLAGFKNAYPGVDIDIEGMKNVNVIIEFYRKNKYVMVIEKLNVIQEDIFD